ncbi:tetratricopeptide repeat protein [Streptomyces sp. NPDC050803]|uniref:phosphorylase family protein n=1 Tax=unclassified Streptomyces TaxID=2593676 RepID=UPI003442A612
MPTIAVLTALPLEYMAVRAHLTDIEKRVHPEYGTRAEVGRLPGTPWQIALLEMGEGTRGAAALTERAMTWLTPQAVLFVGVAGGLKEDIGIGDVVVATKVYAIHGGKETPDGFLDRTETWQAPHDLESAARHALRGKPHIHFKPIAAGEVLLADADSPLAHRLRQRFNDAVAIEMEASGVAHAAHLAGGAGALIIRGISDRADAGKSAADARGSQPEAAARAAEAAVAVLHEWEPKEKPLQHHGPVPTASTTLPPRPLGFTGRSADLSHLLAHLTPTPDAPTAPPLLISAVTGMGGIGKTALAIEAAHQACAQGWFPGGMLFVDLRGYDDNPVTADQAVLALLDALDVRGTDLPTSTARQYDAYRSRLSQHQPRTLLILDNASDPSQFLPLLPGTGHHGVLITSRDRPDSLPLHTVDLETLSEADSIALVTTALSNDPRDDRPSREPEAVRELTALCGHLPLALQIAAAMLRRRRNRDIATLVAEIRRVGDALTVLDHGSRGTDLYGRSLSLRPVLETSYRRLPPDRARLLRLLALAPGADASTEAVAALTGLDLDLTASLLEDLTATGLVTAVKAPRGVRWRLHDLVRAFGAGVVAEDALLREEGEAARVRLLEFYMHCTVRADNRLEWRPGVEEPELFTDRAHALAWLDAERAGLVTAVQWAAGEKRYAYQAVFLANCLDVYLRWRRYFDDAITVARTAQEAAHQAGERGAEAVSWTALGSALREADRVEEAIEAHTRSRDLYRARIDRRGEAIASHNLGNALRDAGRIEEAIEALTLARDAHHASGDQRGEADAWTNLGLALIKQDMVEDAIDAHSRARDLYQAARDRHREGMAWNNLGFALDDAGRMEEAVEAYRKALETHREFEDWYATGATLFNLALNHKLTHRTAEARTLFLQAADAYARANAPAEADDARARAEQLG